VLVVVVVAAQSFSAFSTAARNTTAPGKTVIVHVNITDKGISTATYAPLEVESGQKTLAAVFHLTRGLTAYFSVHNLGKKPHDFVVLGNKTARLAPGAKARFKVVLSRRGSFPYESTLDKGKPGFRGDLVVE
jgi:hypothetical protein